MQYSGYTKNLNHSIAYVMNYGVYVTVAYIMPWVNQSLGWKSTSFYTY